MSAWGQSMDAGGGQDEENGFHFNAFKYAKWTIGCRMDAARNAAGARQRGKAKPATASVAAAPSCAGRFRPFQFVFLRGSSAGST
jgi:hypothetical protein